MVAGILIGCALVIPASSTTSHAQTSIVTVEPLEPLRKPPSVAEIRSRINLLNKYASKNWEINREFEDGSVHYVGTGGHSILVFGNSNKGKIIEGFKLDWFKYTYTYAADGAVTADELNTITDEQKTTTWAPDGTTTTTLETFDKEDRKTQTTTVSAPDGSSKTEQTRPAMHLVTNPVDVLRDFPTTVLVMNPDGSSTTTQTEPTKIPNHQEPGISTTVLVKHPDGSTTTTVMIADENWKVISTHTTSAPAFHSIVGELGTGTPLLSTNSAGGSVGPPPNATPPAGPVAALPPHPAATVCPTCKAIDDQLQSVTSQIEVIDKKITSEQGRDQSIRTHSDLKLAGTKTALNDIAKTIADLKAQRAQLVAKREQLGAQKAACETQCIPQPQNQPPPPTSTNAEPTDSGPPPGAPGNFSFGLGFFGSGGSNQGSFGTSNQRSGFGQQQQQSGRGNGK